MLLRRLVLSLFIMTLVSVACGGDDDPATTQDPTPSQAETPMPEADPSPTPQPNPTATPTATKEAAPTASPTATPTPLATITLDHDESIIRGTRNDEILFTITHDVTSFAELSLTRDPDGILSTIGWQGAVWQVHEIVPGDEGSPGQYLQLEIHRLWPATDVVEMVDVLWLTDYSGVTSDTLTGFTADQSDTFTLFDALVLEGPLDRFGLHPDCRTANDDIAAALVSFENVAPAKLLGWTVDVDSKSFVEVEDPTTLVFGDCGAPKARFLPTS